MPSVCSGPPRPLDWRDWFELCIKWRQCAAAAAAAAAALVRKAKPAIATAHILRGRHPKARARHDGR